MKKSLLILAFVCSFLYTTSSVAEDDTYYQDPVLRTSLTQTISDLENQAQHIKEQYVSVTSRLAKLEYDLPEKFQCLSNLFLISNSSFRVDDNANIFYDSYDLEELEKFMFLSADDRSTIPEPTPFATLPQLLAVSNQVVTLSGSFATLSSNLSSLINTVDAISSSLQSSQHSLQNLTLAYNRLDELCGNLTSAINVSDSGSVVIAKSSPIVGKIEPYGNGWNYPLAQNWDRCCSKFRVSKDTYLESVTLYCDDPNKMPGPLDVYVSTCILDEWTGNYSFTSWPCPYVNTSDFPRCVWTFYWHRNVPILSDRDYLLCIRKTNGALYPYLTSSFRQGGFYKPFGATESLDPTDPEDPEQPLDHPEIPRSNPSPQGWFDGLFAYDWEESMMSHLELWSILKFTDDESFTFSESGLKIESGNITVGGSEVVTSSSLGDMFVSMLVEQPDALNSEITWNMFCQELKNKLITTTGGSVTGLLSVSNLRIQGSGDWTVGSTNNPSDIVIANPSGKISAPNGDLNLLATESGHIQAQSFLQFQNSTQCGVVEIPANAFVSTSITCSGLTSNAIILLTPRQEVTTPYWVEVEASDEAFTVNRPSDGNNLESISFNYLIIRK